MSGNFNYSIAIYIYQMLVQWFPPLLQLWVSQTRLNIPIIAAIRSRFTSQPKLTTSVSSRLWTKVHTRLYKRSIRWKTQYVYHVFTQQSISCQLALACRVILFWSAQEQLWPDTLPDVTNYIYWIRTQDLWIKSKVI